MSLIWARLRRLISRIISPAKTLRRHLWTARQTWTPDFKIERTVLYSFNNHHHLSFYFHHCHLCCSSSQIPQKTHLRIVEPSVHGGSFVTFFSLLLPASKPSAPKARLIQPARHKKKGRVKSNNSGVLEISITTSSFLSIEHHPFLLTSQAT